MFYNIIFSNQNHCFYFSLPILVNMNSSHLVTQIRKLRLIQYVYFFFFLFFNFFLFVVNFVIH